MSTERPGEADEFSAGGVVLKDGDVAVIVPVKRAADGRRVLGLPKGHPDGDETPEQAALREVAEETGVVAELIDELGDVRYHYERRGRRVEKVVRFFRFRYRSGDLADHDHEIEEARWMPLEEAARALTYAGEREMVRRAMSRRAPDR
jgi:8-oxo-dGTP pyrophosphatase MutT (NUDIX family)